MQTKHTYRHYTSAIRAARRRIKKATVIVFRELIKGEIRYSVWF